MALCALYVGVESGIGGFEATSLRAGGVGQAAAASWTAGYWAAITIGRLAIGRMAVGRIRLKRLEIDELTVRRLNLLND